MEFDLVKHESPGSQQNGEYFWKDDVFTLDNRTGQQCSQLAEVQIELDFSLKQDADNAESNNEKDSYDLL